MKYILNRAPHLVSTLDANGRLPLALALESGRSWYLGGVRELVHALPESLSTVDVGTGLLPFMLAAAADRNDELRSCKKRKGLNGSAVEGKESELHCDQLTTIFHLLLENPVMVLFGINSGLTRSLLNV